MHPYLNSRQVRPWLPWLLLFTVCAVLQVTHSYASLRLELRPPQWAWLYSVFTCHLVHLNSRHWLHNSLALLVIAVFFARQYRWHTWLISVVVSALCVSLGMLLFYPQWHTYAGLSGLLHGLFAMGCLLLYRDQPRLAIGLGVLMLVKLTVEHWSGPLSQTLLDFPVAGSAHVYGVIGGMISWVSCRLFGVRQR